MSEPDKKANEAAPPHQDEWPDTVRTRSELDAALEEGERSGRSSKTMREIVKEVLGERRGD